MWYNNILETIGDTPLVKLGRVASHLKCNLLAKVEYFNPGNSIKDRIGIKLIEDAEKEYWTLDCAIPDKKEGAKPIRLGIVIVGHSEDI